jgi:hypothetical protein
MRQKPDWRQTLEAEMQPEMPEKARVYLQVMTKQ